MKNKTCFVNLIFIAIQLLFLTGCVSSKNNTSLQEGEAFKLVDSRKFSFIAENVSPLRGRTRYLSSEYSITLNNDSLVSYLPFFGNSTQVPMNPSESGIQFTSTNFSYKVVEGKKNQMEITIIPHDRRDIQQLYFVIFDNGTGSLNVTSTFRDPISFNGHLRSIK